MSCLDEFPELLINLLCVLVCDEMPARKLNHAGNWMQFSGYGSSMPYLRNDITPAMDNRD